MMWVILFVSLWFLSGYIAARYFVFMDESYTTRDGYAWFLLGFYSLAYAFGDLTHKIAIKKEIPWRKIIFSRSRSDERK